MRSQVFEFVTIEHESRQHRSELYNCYRSPNSMPHSGPSLLCCPQGSKSSRIFDERAKERAKRLAQDPRQNLQYVQLTVDLLPSRNGDEPLGCRRKSRLACLISSLELTMGHVTTEYVVTVCITRSYTVHCFSITSRAIWNIE